MRNDYLLEILNYNKESSYDFLNEVMKNIVYDRQNTGVSNCILLWENILDYNSPFYGEAYYPHKINIQDYLSKEILFIENMIGPMPFNSISDVYRKDFIYIQSFCALPLFNPLNSSKGVLILLSQNEDIILTKIHLESLNKILNLLLVEIANRNIGKVHKTFEVLSNFKKNPADNISFENKFDCISNAFRMISAEHINDNGLKHYAVWKINNIKDENFFLVKERNENFLNVNIDYTHKILRKNKDNHFLVKYVEFLKAETDKANCELESLIKIFPISLIRSDFKDPSYYERLGIEVDTSVVVILPILYHEGYDICKMNICCFYISNPLETFFFNKQILKTFSYKIYESLTLMNYIIKSRSMKELLKFSTESISKKEFYNNASKIIKEKNDSECCLIYYINNSTERLELLNDHSTTSVFNLYNYECDFPNEYIDDKEFIEFMNEIDINSLKSVEKITYNINKIYHAQKDTSKVKTALFMPIIKANKINRFTGFILFINKIEHRKGSQYCCSYFTINNINVTTQCVRFIYQYELLQETVNSRDALLKRLRHEIPGEVNFINQNIDLIKEIIDPQKCGINLKHFSNIINQLSLSAIRIELFADFATSISYDKEKILQNPEELNIEIFLSSMIDIFRFEGRVYGVSVYFKMIDDCKVTLLVSKLFKLSIINIIHNAIRYSRFGTNVYIEITPEHISVSNVGIGISENEMSKIYQEGYRGKKAIRYSRDGIGLGLFLSKKIIEAHDGKITCESNFISNSNIFGIKSMHKYFKTIDTQKRNQIICNELEEEDYNLGFDAYNEIKPVVDCEMLFVNIDNEIIENFFDYQCNTKKILFLDFKEKFIDIDVYKTVFTIKYK